MRRSWYLLVVAVAMFAAGCSGGDGSPAANGAAGPSSGSSSPAASGPGSAPSPAGPGSDIADAFTPQLVDWSSCGGGIDCATLAVPLDYAHPDGPMVNLALNRRPATDKKNRKGSLLVNPGGPGGSGKDMLGDLVQSSSAMPKALTDVYDLVGFDPRGVGASDALTCGSEQIAAYRAVDSSPDNPAEQAALDDAAASVGTACNASDGARLPFLGTDSVVRDMDVIRRAVGDTKLTYLGFSYGTLLGLRYLKLFPERAGAVVLDGVVDPTADLTTLLQGQAVAFEAALDRNLAKPDDMALYERVSAKVEKQPITGDGGTLGPSELAVAADFVAYEPNGGPRLVDALHKADDGDPSGVLQLADAYVTDLQFPLYIDVECIDSTHPQGRAAWAAFAEQAAQVAPHVGFSIANEMAPCAEWPVPPSPVNGPVDGAGGPPVLVIGTKGDPATPYTQAQSVAAGLQDGHLLTFDGDGHTAWFSSGCVRQAGADYFLEGELPDSGTTCSD